MSYVPFMTPDARAEWMALEIRFQESVLDELERLCQSPPMGSDVVTDVVAELDGFRHYMFTRVRPDHSNRTLLVMGVGYVKRPIPRI